MLIAGAAAALFLSGAVTARALASAGARVAGGAVISAQTLLPSTPPTDPSLDAYATALSRIPAVARVDTARGGTCAVAANGSGRGPSDGTVTSSTGAQTWQAQAKSTSAGTLTNLAASPSITVNAADGSGTLTSGTANVANGSTQNTVAFTYTAAAGGISNGAHVGLGGSVSR